MVNMTIASKGKSLERVNEFNKSLLLLINFPSLSFNLSSLKSLNVKQPSPSFVVAVFLIPKYTHFQ